MIYSFLNTDVTWMTLSPPISQAIAYTVGAGLVDNSVLKQDLYAQPAPILEPCYRLKSLRYMIIFLLNIVNKISYSVYIFV
jgi:hypothetical protein